MYLCCALHYSKKLSTYYRPIQCCTWNVPLKGEKQDSTDKSNHNLAAVWLITMLNTVWQTCTTSLLQEVKSTTRKCMYSDICIVMSRTLKILLIDPMVNSGGRQTRVTGEVKWLTTWDSRHRVTNNYLTVLTGQTWSTIMSGSKMISGLYYIITH